MHRRFYPPAGRAGSTVWGMHRPRPVLLFALLAVLAALAVPAGASARSPAERGPQAGQLRAVERGHDLAGDMVRPERRPGLLARIRTWPGNRIPYHESLPRKWQWSLDRAIDHWNSAGGGITFVKVPRSRARLTIGYGNTGYADGMATLGFQHRNWVRLSPRYRRVNEHDPAMRVWVGRLLAHELGHVLGFDHTAGQCSLMHWIYDFGACPPLPDNEPGYYFCRWIDKPLLRRFVRLYGGSPSRPPRLCLIEELPPQLRDVTFTGGGGDGPVRISWRAGRVREGTKVRLAVWKGAEGCEGMHALTTATRDPSVGSWSDPRFGVGQWCYRVWIENRYGARRPDFTQRLERHAPVPQPPDGTLVWSSDDGMYRYTWSAPRGTSLRYRSFVAPEECVTTYDEDTAEWPSRDGDDWFVHAVGPQQCLVLFAVSEWGTVSTPTVLDARVPAPDVVPTVGPVSPAPEDPSAATATVSLPDDRYEVGIEVVAGSCPAGPPPDAQWQDGWESFDEPGRWVFYTENWDDTGPQCAMFAAVDRTFWGRPLHGPVVMRPFSVPAP
jgi:hypothetical protein